MIRVLQFNGHSVSEISVDNMDFHQVKWVDCYELTKEELQKVQNIINIPRNELDRCVDEDERPGLTELEHFSMAIFKCPFKTNRKISTTSMSILISKHLIVTFRKRDIEGLNKIWDLDEKTKNHIFQKGTSSLTYQLLENIMDDYFKILDDIEKEIDLVENVVFHNPDKKTVMKIFSLKKILIFFHKALSTNREMLSSIDKEYAEKIESKQIKNFRYVYDDTVQLIDMVATYRDLLTGSLDIYLSSVSNNLNTIMKRMTALGSLVLVPTFITGLYGMNFRYMPEIAWKYGYLLVWALIIGSVIFLFTFFKRKDWF